jgi:hypothetical protein
MIDALLVAGLAAALTGASMACFHPERWNAVSASAGVIEVLHRAVLFALALFALYVLLRDVLVGREFSVLRLAVLNTAFCLLVLSVAVYKMCPLTLWYNIAGGQPLCKQFEDYGQLTYKSDIDRAIGNPVHDCRRNTWLWLDSHVRTTLFMAAVNATYAVKLALF